MGARAVPDVPPLHGKRVGVMSRLAYPIAAALGFLAAMVTTETREMRRREQAAADQHFALWEMEMSS